MVVIFAINLATPFLPIPSQIVANLAGVAITLLYVAAVIGFALAVARRQLRIRWALAWVALCALAWMSVEYGMNPFVERTFRAINRVGGQPTSAQLVTFFYTQSLQDVALMSGAAFAGTLIAKMIRHANLLVPICVGIALIDIWGVLFGGIVSQMMNNAATAPIAAKAMTAGPQIGAVGAARPEFSLSLPPIGIGDFLFAALLLSVIVNLKMNWKDAARWMFGLVSLALLGLTFIKEFPPLPGLLFIGLGAILPNLKYSTYTREEKFALLWGGLFVVVLTTGLYFAFKFGLPQTS